MGIIKLAGYENIYMSDSFEHEYQELFGKDQRSFAKCQKKLYANLRILDAEGAKASHYQQFERLVDEPFYAIRHVSKLNPRVIYAYVSDMGKVILLTSLLEKNTSDYGPAISRAHRIIKQLGVSLK